MYIFIYICIYIYTNMYKLNCISVCTNTYIFVVYLDEWIKANVHFIAHVRIPTQTHTYIHICT